MQPSISSPAASRMLYLAAAFVVVVAGMRAASPLLVLFLVSVFIAIICSAPIGWLHDKGVSLPLATLLVICGTVVVVLAVVTLIGNSVSDFLGKLPEYQAQLTSLKTSVLDWTDKRGLKVSQLFDQEGFGPERVVGLLGGLLNATSAVFSNTFLILLTVVFLLLEASELPAKLDAMPGDGEVRKTRFAKIVTDVRHYVAIKTWMSLLTGAIVAAILLLLGVDYALLWGLLAFLFNFVPNIGSVLAAVPAILLALVQLGFASALYATFGYLAVNIVVGNVIEPRITGKGLGLSTLVVFLSLVFWGWVLGPVGMVLSVPLTMIVKIYLESAEETRPLAILLGSEAPKE